MSGTLCGLLQNLAQGEPQGPGWWPAAGTGAGALRGRGQILPGEAVQHHRGFADQLSGTAARFQAREPVTS